MKDSGLVKRVRNEVEIHCQLKHPTVLEVLFLTILKVHNIIIISKLYIILNIFYSEIPRIE